MYSESFVEDHLYLFVSRFLDLAPVSIIAGHGRVYLRFQTRPMENGTLSFVCLPLGNLLHIWYRWPICR